MNSFPTAASKLTLSGLLLVTTLSPSQAQQATALDRYKALTTNLLAENVDISVRFDSLSAELAKVKAQLVEKEKSCQAPPQPKQD